MSCGNVKIKQVKLLKIQTRALNTSNIFGLYLIFSSGSSAFIPK